MFRRVDPRHPVYYRPTDTLITGSVQSRKKKLQKRKKRSRESLWRRSL